MLQVQSEEGPCRDAVRTGRPVSVPDIERSDRWPTFTEVALRRGLRAVHAIPLRHRADTIGGLNLFRTTPHAWSERDSLVARALADVAAIGIVHERAAANAETVRTQLQNALDSRVVIEQVKGALAAQAQIGPDVAFRLLRRCSRVRRVRLRDIAARVVDGSLRVGDLDPDGDEHPHGDASAIPRT